MFWGLIMEPGKKYTQTVEKSFHVSQAALDLDSARDGPVQVLLGFENRNYLLCTLHKDKWVQVPIDLNFQVGDKVSFATNGPGHVHLTGYLVPEEDYDLMEEESDEEEQEDEEIPELLPVNNKKRKADNKNEKQSKKSKSETAKLLEEIPDEDDDDEDDSDVSSTDLLNDEAVDEEEDGEEEEDEDDDEDDDDDDDDDEELEESEEEEKPVQKKEKPKQNGIVKGQEKQKGDKSLKQNKKQEVNNKQQKGDKSPKQDKSAKQDNSPQQDKGDKSPKQKGKRVLSGGVTVEDIKVGQGAIATAGRQVHVLYEGRLQSNNKIFDSTRQGNVFKFRLGRKEVIKGWEVGLTGMKVGGKRRIVCPPNMAYGAQGSPPVIPPQSTLVFDIELKNVK